MRGDKHNRRGHDLTPGPKAMKPVPLKKIAEETGFSTRYWRAKAAAGELRGAHQPSGPRGGWRVDLIEFRQWWAEGRPKKWRASSGEAKSHGAARHVTASNDEQALERAIAKWQSDASTRGSQS